MKKLIRFSTLVAFAVVNLALFAVPADAGRTTKLCLADDGTENACCVWCIFLCMGCFPDDGGDDGLDGSDGENT